MRRPRRSPSVGEEGEEEEDEDEMGKEEVEKTDEMEETEETGGFEEVGGAEEMGRAEQAGPISSAAGEIGRRRNMWFWAPSTSLWGRSKLFGEQIDPGRSRTNRVNECWRARDRLEAVFRQ